MGTDFLANITAEYPLAHGGKIFRINLASVFDRQVTDALARIHLPRGDRRCRARIDTTRTGATWIWLLTVVGFQIHRRHNRTKEQPAADALVNEEGVLTDRTNARLGCQLSLE